MARLPLQIRVLAYTVSSPWLFKGIATLRLVCANLQSPLTGSLSQDHCQRSITLHSVTLRSITRHGRRLFLSLSPQGLFTVLRYFPFLQTAS